MMRGGGLLLTLALFCAPAAWAQDALVSDLSERQVDIRYSFAGADLLLFGAINRQATEKLGGFDIVAVVRGPVRRAVVRKKARRFGIWMNNEALRYETAPGYYAVAATRPLEEVTSRRSRTIYQIGLDSLMLSPAAEAGLSSQQMGAFREGLIRHRMKEGLYRASVTPIEIVGGSLFRTSVALPATVPIGLYRVDVFLVSDGDIVGRTMLQLNVDKSGFERYVYDMAKTQPLIYGLVAVLIALLAGWAAGALFRQK